MIRRTATALALSAATVLIAAGAVAAADQGSEARTGAWVGPGVVKAWVGPGAVTEAWVGPGVVKAWVGPGAVTEAWVGPGAVEA
ncbi:hypothetical protein [Actinacidiphila glaucinigra]|uniref:Uncharacterized protein n=1 Tax=Actinacidiphila glaucinigra TaxID=235986 RepID=A0A239M2Q9_9ACTN|nr:hypothetical protein [Actinacidiphila glaucinigra]SNT36234.1 hypothetical protein SAMN05216252_12264 [Actinacidiphila glaucinigra]